MGTGWIKFDARMLDNPLVFEMGELLKKSPDSMLNAMLRLWCWLDSQDIEENPEGGFSVMMLDSIVRESGFSLALGKVGLATLQDNGFVSLSDDCMACTLSITKKRALDSVRQQRRRLGVAGNALPCAALLRKMDAGKGNHGKRRAR